MQIANYRFFLFESTCGYSARNNRLIAYWRILSSASGQRLQYLLELIGSNIYNLRMSLRPPALRTVHDFGDAVCFYVVPCFFYTWSLCQTHVLLRLVKGPQVSLLIVQQCPSGIWALQRSDGLIDSNSPCIYLETKNSFKLLYYHFANTFQAVVLDFFQKGGH